MIGFIGQGWIGKNYSDNLIKRGYEVIRYSLDEPFKKNKDKVKECDIVFIAVPTPTTKKGCDSSIVEDAVRNVGAGKIAVIKSTVVPGTTEKIQGNNRNIFVFHSPEFLREATVEYDVANPQRNIVGIPIDNKQYRDKAKKILNILPKAPYEIVCPAREAELIKYASNCYLYTKVIFINLFHDLAQELGCDWSTIRDAMKADKRLGASHMDPIHQSGRGAGGHCFIKDFAAFRSVYESMVLDKKGLAVLKAIEKKNIDLLKNTNKDLDLLSQVYGSKI